MGVPSSSFFHPRSRSLRSYQIRVPQNRGNTNDSLSRNNVNRFATNFPRIVAVTGNVVLHFETSLNI